MDAELEVKIASFWRWFGGEHMLLERELEGATWLSVQKLDRYVRALDERLRWDIGPGEDAPWMFVLSPNGQRELLEVTEAIMAHAPELPHWEFHAARPKRRWAEGRRRFDYDGIEVDADDWSYWLEPQGSFFEITWIVPDLDALHGVDPEALGQHLLECELGEKNRLRHFTGVNIASAAAWSTVLVAEPIGTLRARWP